MAAHALGLQTQKARGAAATDGTPELDPNQSGAALRNDSMFSCLDQRV